MSAESESSNGDSVNGIGSNYVTPVLTPATYFDEDEFGPSVADRAWAAGFFDGEGCILGARNGKAGSYHYYLVVSVGQVDERPLKFLESLFGGSVHVHKARTATTKKSSIWVATGGYARNFLKSVEPFLRVKGERARTALSVNPQTLYSMPNKGDTLARRSTRSAS